MNNMRRFDAAGEGEKGVLPKKEKADFPYHAVYPLIIIIKVEEWMHKGLSMGEGGRVRPGHEHGL
jgi:hypothetical protein